MKRIIGLILAVMLITMSVAGCGNNEDPVAEDVRVVDERPQEPEETIDDGVVNEPEEDEAVSGNEEPPVDDTNGYTLGRITGNTFESPWIGLSFTAPGDFVMATQEEVLSMVGLGLDALEMDDFVANLLDIMVIYEMMAMTPDGASSVSIITERLMLSGIRIEQWIELSFAGVEDMLGWVVHFNDDLTTVNFAGREWYHYTATIEALGMLWSYEYLAQRIDNSIVLIQMYTLEGNESIFEDIKNAFSPF